MGMFDSLYIELDGRELPIQTKRFDCVLGDYRLGDWIGGAAPGIRVYFDNLSLDAKGALVYGVDAARARTLTLFVVLAHGVFVDYRIRDGELAPDAIEHALMELREAWQDSARLLGFLIETLRSKQQRIETLERRLDRIASVVDSTRRLRAGETLGDRFRLIHEEQQKLDAGEDPLEVVAWVLDDKKADSGRWGEGTVTDPLDDYRL